MSEEKKPTGLQTDNPFGTVTFGTTPNQNDGNNGSFGWSFGTNSNNDQNSNQQTDSNPASSNNANGDNSEKPDTANSNMNAVTFGFPNSTNNGSSTTDTETTSSNVDNQQEALTTNTTQTVISSNVGWTFGADTNTVNDTNTEKPAVSTGFGWNFGATDTNNTAKDEPSTSDNTWTFQTTTTTTNNDPFASFNQQRNNSQNTIPTNDEEDKENMPASEDVEVTDKQEKKEQEQGQEQEQEEKPTKAPTPPQIDASQIDQAAMRSFWQQFQQQTSNQWCCAVCSNYNNLSVEQCEACDAPRADRNGGAMPKPEPMEQAAASTEQEVQPSNSAQTEQKQDGQTNDRPDTEMKEAEQESGSSKWDPSTYLNVLNKNNEILRYESPFPHPVPQYFPYLHDGTERELKEEGDETAETWTQFDSDGEEEQGKEEEKAEQDTDEDVTIKDAETTNSNSKISREKPQISLNGAGGDNDDEDEEENYRVRVYRQYKRRRMLCKQKIAMEDTNAARVKPKHSIICMAGDGSVSGALGTGNGSVTSVKDNWTTFPIPLRPLHGKKIKMISTGIMSTAVVTENNEIYTWGLNDKSGLSINPENIDEVDIGDDDDQLSEEEAWDRLYSHYVSLLSNLYRKYNPEKLETPDFVENLVLKQKHGKLVIKYKSRHKELKRPLYPEEELEKLVDQYAARYHLIRKQVSYHTVIDIAKTASNIHNNLYLRVCKKYNVDKPEQHPFIPTATKQEMAERRDRKLNPYKYLLQSPTKQTAGKNEEDNDDENLFPYVQPDEDWLEDEYQGTIACSYWTPARIRLPLRNVIVKQVTLGGSHMVLLDTLGRVFSCGTFCSDGVVGHHWDFETLRIIRYQRELKQLKHMQSTNDNRKTNQRGDHLELPPMESIASGINHFLMLDKKGHIWAMGVSKLGQKTSTRNQRKYLSPQIVSIVNKKTKQGTRRKTSVKFKKIACGNHHNLAIDIDGELYSWGQNIWGQCGHEARYNGHGDVIDQPRSIEFYEPKKNIDDEDEENVAVQDYRIEDVVAGEHMTVALDANGNVWTCGRNACQQLGRKTRWPGFEMKSGVSVKTEVEPDLMRMVTDLKNIVIDWIGCGSVFWFAHNKHNGSVYAYGDSSNGRAGVGKWAYARGRPVFDEHNFDLDKYEVVAADGGSDHVCFHVRKKMRLRRRHSEIALSNNNSREATPLSDRDRYAAPSDAAQKIDAMNTDENSNQGATDFAAISGVSMSHKPRRTKRKRAREEMTMTPVKENPEGADDEDESECMIVDASPPMKRQKRGNKKPTLDRKDPKYKGSGKPKFQAPRSSTTPITTRSKSQSE